MATHVKLKSCPYCRRGEFLKIVKKPSHNQVNCEFCGGRGPIQSHNDEKSEVELWNTRDESALETLTLLWQQYFLHQYAPPDIKERVKRVLDNDES